MRRSTPYEVTWLPATAAKGVAGLGRRAHIIIITPMIRRSCFEILGVGCLDMLLGARRALPLPVRVLGGSGGVSGRDEGTWHLKSCAGERRAVPCARGHSPSSRASLRETHL